MGHTILIYAVFVVGYLLHMMLQVDAIVRAKNNAAFSRWCVIRQNEVVLATRFFLSLIVFWFIRQNPQFLTQLLGYVGITLSPGIGESIGDSSWGVAGMFGYMIDSILTFIPFLKNYVPPISSSINPNDSKDVKISDSEREK